MSEARAALICAVVPAIVTVPLPSPVTVAPLPPVTVSVPLPAGRLRVVERLALSTSATASPVITRGVSSSVLWARGKVLTGRSLTGLTVTSTVVVSSTPPEVTV